MLDEAALNRFWSQVDKQSGGCWIWLGYKQGGYGVFYSRGTYRNHRLSYTMSKGEIPQGLVIDHLCRNPARINPDHLEAVTNGVNTLRGTSGLRGAKLFENKEQVCHRGHERSDANTYVRPGGQKNCRICKKEQCLEARRRKGITAEKASRNPATGRWATQAEISAQQEPSA